MSFSAPPTCPACGLSSPPGALCDQCAPADAFLAPQATQRLEALAAATAADRPKVLLAALRGGARLWSGQGPDGGDLSLAILGWLARKSPTLDFLRWLSEDAVYGHLAYATLARQDPAYALRRAPLWLAPGRPAAHPEALILGWSSDLKRLLALAFRVGGQRRSEDWERQVIDATPSLAHLPFRQAVHAGHARPSSEAFPEDTFNQAAIWRRWPARRFERDPAGQNCIVYCVRCGEFAPQHHGPCPWCQVDPELPGLRLLGTAAMLWEDRQRCPDCGIDRNMRIVPQQCPGCKKRIAWGRRPLHKV